MIVINDNQKKGIKYLISGLLFFFIIPKILIFLDLYTPLYFLYRYYLIFIIPLILIYIGIIKIKPNFFSRVKQFLFKNADDLLIINDDDDDDDPLDELKNYIIENDKATYVYNCPSYEDFAGDDDIYINDLEDTNGELILRLDRWDVYNGEYVKKEQYICSIREKYGHFDFYDDKSTEFEGYIEILKETTTDINENCLMNNEKLFIIHKSLDKNKKLELKHKRFNNKPIIEVDEFSKTKIIKWDYIAGKKPKLFIYNHPKEGAKVNRIHRTDEFSDCFILSSSDNNNYLLIITINYIDNKDYLIIRYPTKEYKLGNETTIQFLFENQEMITFENFKNSFLYTKSSDNGNINEVRVQLTGEELEIFKQHHLLKWQIKFNNSIKKIVGVIDENNKFSIKKLFNEYYNIVNVEIDNYKPLNEIDKLPKQKIKNNETCYVYLMIDYSNNFYKIGISNKPFFREKTLQSEKPTIEMVINKEFPSRKIATILEKTLHQTYSEKRVRGEWFNLNEIEIKEIKDILK